MTKIEELDEYSVQIGAEDIIKSKVPAFSANPEKTDSKLHDILKETRVRIGTLLKTDNVSFLMGAGTSISAGGVSLAKIPIQLEELLCEKAKNDTESNPEWIELFYETISVLSTQSFLIERLNKVIEHSKDIKEIPINVEEYLSHLHMWLAGMGEITNKIEINKTDAIKLVLKKDIVKKLITEVTHSLSTILNLPTKGKEEQLNIHRKFIKKILTRPLNLRRVNLFTLNYDTLIEQGADAEGAVLVDGFIGTLRRVFRPESYDLDFYFPAQTTEGRVHRFDRALHLYKLHGSLTWHRTKQGWENPYGLYATFFNQNCHEDDVLIYPTPLKYGQALGLPYSELFRRFGNAVIQPQSVLFIIRLWIWG